MAFCDLGYDLIYAPGNQYTDAILQAAEEYPNIAFALLNGGADTPAKAHPLFSYRSTNATKQGGILE